MIQVPCPPPAELERLFLGCGSEEELSALEQHLLQCGSCLETLKTLLDARETLTGLLRSRPGLVSASDHYHDSPVVADLLQTLQSLRMSPAGSSHQGIAVTPDDRTLPPAPVSTSANPDQLSPTEAGNRPTPAPSDDLDATCDSKTPPRRHDSSLTDFLAPPQAEDELGRLGKYRILKVLGHGGMGVVFQAEDPLLKRTVAIKAMLPTLAVSASAGQRFLREAQAMARVKHDHIVTIYQVDEERGVPFLAMEFLQGEPLDQRLSREEKLPVDEVLRIGREIARALAAAHATGLIHRDIKPANIWLERREGEAPADPGEPGASAPGVSAEASLTVPSQPEDRVKILDFGLARAAAQESGLTQQGAIIGTPSFMAPEQARGDPVDGRCDLFSLGVVLYRLCTGRLPFQGTDTVSTLMAVVMHQPAPPIQFNAVPPELSDLVMRLLEKDPNQRFGTAGEVVQALQTLEKNLAQQKEEAQTTTGSRPAPSKPRRRLTLAAAALVLASLIGVGAVALIRFTTEQGDFVIKTDDPNFSFRVNKGGGVTLTDHKTKRDYILNVVRQERGEWELEATDEAADLSFKSKTFTIKRGGKVALQTWFERKLPANDARLKEIAALPAEKQVEAVAGWLKERNPGFDGKETHQIEGGVVTELQFLTRHVTDLTPVRALPGLRKLDCAGSDDRKGQLADLSPLKGMQLTHLEFGWTHVSDLSPLKDMPLTILDCGFTPVTDLTPLKDMKLKVLHCADTRVHDLSPLTGMKLTELVCFDTQVSDLSPLKDMKLTNLNFSRTQVSDLSPLKDMKLTRLWCDGSQVSELEPLKWMKLKLLWCQGTQVSDLSPLKAMPLEEIFCDFKPQRDTQILQSIKTLEKINDKPAQEFWKEALTVVRLKRIAALPADQQVTEVAGWLKERNPDFDGKVEHKIEDGVATELNFLTDNVTDLSPVRALPGLQRLGCYGSDPGKGRLADLSPLKNMKLTELHAWSTRVADLTPLKGMPLTILNCDDTNIADLSPLKDMKLTSLFFRGSRVSDLSPLKDMPLTSCNCTETPVADLTPLKGMPLTILWCGGSQVADLSPLKDMKLTELGAWSTRVSDLSPLKGMPLTLLNCDDTNIADLAPLKDMKLTSLFVRNSRVSDLSPLKDMPLTSFNCLGTRVSDLSPLKGMPLTTLWCGGSQVTDLSPLKGMKLERFWCDGAPVADLSPLKGMKLNLLWCQGTQVTDLSPLKEMPLQEIFCDFKPQRDTAILRSIKTLEKINDKPVREFWKDVEASQLPIEPAWFAKLAGLPADMQVEEVAEMLKKRNQGFDGKVMHQIEEGVVTELKFLSHQVTDLSPLRALSGLLRLGCAGTRKSGDSLLTCPR